MSATKAQSYLCMPASTYRFDRVSVQHESSHFARIYAVPGLSYTVTLLYTFHLHSLHSRGRDTRWFVSWPVAQQHQRKKKICNCTERKKRRTRRLAVPCIYLPRFPLQVFLDCGAALLGSQKRLF